MLATFPRALANSVYAEQILFLRAWPVKCPMRAPTMSIFESVRRDPLIKQFGDYRAYPYPACASRSAPVPSRLPVIPTTPGGGIFQQATVQVRAVA